MKVDIISTRFIYQIYPRACVHGFYRFNELEQHNIGLDIIIKK